MSGVWPTPEQESMLLACLAPDAEAAAAFDRISANWDTARADAGCSQLLPLLYRRWPARPDAIVASGQKAHLAIWRQNRERLRRIDDLLEEFRREKIPCVVLKGAAMIKRYYADPGLRGMRDFDLLVHPEGVARAVHLLTGMGYAAEQNLATAAILGRVRTGHGWQFSLGNNESCDLHWRPVVRCFAPEVTDLFWAGAEEADGWLTLSPTDQLFHVSVHALQWDWIPQIRWVADAMTILHQPVDWERMVRLADAARMRARVGRALEYLRVHFAAPVPNAVMVRLNASAPAWERHEYELLLKPCPLGFRDSFAWHRHHFRRIREFDPVWRDTPAWLGFAQYVREFLNGDDIPDVLRKLSREAQARLGINKARQD